VNAKFFVTTNVPDFNHHKGTKTLRTPSISKLFLFFVPLWLRVFVVSSRTTLVVTIFRYGIGGWMFRRDAVHGMQTHSHRAGEHVLYGFTNQRHPSLRANSSR
jgi:hypothetical protein